MTGDVESDTEDRYISSNKPTQMKKTLSTLLLALASAGTLPAAVIIDIANNTPNGIASGGSGSGTGSISSTSGTITSDRGLPVTTYTVSGVDLTSVGGPASHSFTFTVTYSATTDGSTPGTAQFNGFGNVSVTGGADNNQVEGAETLTATIALASNTFSGLTLTGFTTARAGGVSTTPDEEAGTFTWAGGGSFDITSNANRVANDITGDSITLAVSTGNMNLEGFGARFEAVPEPASASLLALGAVALLRRRRTA